MRSNRPRLRTVAAWLGVIALSFNALFPIQYAFGLAAELALARECGHIPIGAAPPDPAWRVFALLTGNDKPADPARSHTGFHPLGGAICGFVATPAGFTASTAAALPLPACRESAAAAVVTLGNAAPAAPAGYCPRAPPTRTAPIPV